MWWITWEPPHLYLTQLGFTDTTTPLYRQNRLTWHHCFLKKDTKKMLFPWCFTYAAILTVYPHLKRIALLPKLSIIFHSTVTCLSNLCKKAVKNNYFFSTCLDLCLSRVLSNNSKWKLREIWKQSGKRPYRDLTAFGVCWQRCSGVGVLLLPIYTLGSPQAHHELRSLASLERRSNCTMLSIWVTEAHQVSFLLFDKILWGKPIFFM